MTQIKKLIAISTCWHIICVRITNTLTIEDNREGTKPWLNGNTQRPIYFPDTNITNLIIRNIDRSGQNFYTDNETNLSICGVNGLLIDGVEETGYKCTAYIPPTRQNTYTAPAAG
jgi:hypothetical protein